METITDRRKFNRPSAANVVRMRNTALRRLIDAVERTEAWHPELSPELRARLAALATRP